MADKMIHYNHPDDERYDQINIYIVPRWKESELSGDEWRFSYVADVIRKDETIMSIGASKLEWLLTGLQWRIQFEREKDNFDLEAWKRTENKCDQPGCANVATVFYKRIKTYTKRGQKLADSEEQNSYRQFCENHITRGDCDLDDADANYSIISKESTNG